MQWQNLNLNQTINEINLRLVDLETQEIQNKPFSLEEWDNVETIYPIDLIIDETDGFEQSIIQVSNVPLNVCQILVKEMSLRSDVSINDSL